MTVMAALARLYRHLPVEDDEQRELVALLDKEHPLATLDEAMEELVVTIADAAYKRVTCHLLAKHEDIYRRAAAARGNHHARRGGLDLS